MLVAEVGPDHCKLCGRPWETDGYGQVCRGNQVHGCDVRPGGRPVWMPTWGRLGGHGTGGGSKSGRRRKKPPKKMRLDLWQT